jgi:hypothetical protein
VLDLIEEALNEVALAVECEVAVADLSFRLALGGMTGVMSRAWSLSTYASES